MASLKKSHKDYADEFLSAVGSKDKGAEKGAAALLAYVEDMKKSGGTSAQEAFGQALQWVARREEITIHGRTTNELAIELGKTYPQVLPAIKSTLGKLGIAAS